MEPHEAGGIVIVSTRWAEREDKYSRNVMEERARLARSCFLVRVGRTGDFFLGEEDLGDDDFCALRFRRRLFVADVLMAWMDSIGAASVMGEVEGASEISTESTGEISTSSISSESSSILSCKSYISNVDDDVEKDTERMIWFVILSVVLVSDDISTPDIEDESADSTEEEDVTSGESLISIMNFFIMMVDFIICAGFSFFVESYVCEDTKEEENQRFSDFVELSLRMYR